jgi:hypothetical protein
MRHVIVFSLLSSLVAFVGAQQFGEKIPIGRWHHGLYTVSGKIMDAKTV